MNLLIRMLLCFVIFLHNRDVLLDLHYTRTTAIQHQRKFEFF